MAGKMFIKILTAVKFLQAFDHFILVLVPEFQLTDIDKVTVDKVSFLMSLQLFIISEAIFTTVNQT